MSYLPFRVFYYDGSSFLGYPEDVPSWGVIAIVQETKDGRRHILSDHPYYMFTDEANSWMAAKENDVIESLANRCGEIRAFCVGRLVSRDQFNRVYQWAKEYKNAESL